MMIAALSGCGSAASTGAPPRAAPSNEPADEAGPERVHVDRMVITSVDASDIPELFDQATEQLAAGKAAEAARAFDRIYEIDPDGRLAPEALFRAGVAHDHAGDLDAAFQRLEQVARRFPDHHVTREALVRAVRILAFLERWQRAGQAADLLLARYSDLRPFETIVAHSGKALALVFSGDVDGAQHHVGKAMNIVDRNRLDSAGKLPRDLAQLYFAQGEIRRLKGERINFDPVPKNFGQRLEQRCQLLLDAQRSYSDTMRAYDAHWSAMAGFRVGELYQRLHADLMKVPPPATADTERSRQLFEGAMRLRYSILLTKGMTMMEHTVSMAKRTGERSAWVLRAEDAKRGLERAIQDEKVAIDRLPYTRAQLQEALDDLAAKAREATKP